MKTQNQHTGSKGFWVFATIILLFFCTSPVIAATTPQSIDIGGVYETNFGDLTITQMGNRITGSYPTGTIEGTVLGPTVKGTWVQAYSQGKFVFEFQSNAGSFKGLWGSGGDTPSSAWDGIRKNTSSKVIASQIVPPPHAFIAGTYGSSYGDIEFTQNDKFVHGTYPTGTIKGTMEGKVLSGQWREESSSGLLRFEFSNDLSSFKGYWGSGEAPPTSKWDGDRKGMVQPQPASTKQLSSQFITIGNSYDSDYGEIVFWQDGSFVEGAYPTGTIEGHISGSTLEGQWFESSGSGSIRFEFSANGDRFQGWWASSGGILENKWDGMLSSSFKSNGVIDSDYGRIEGFYTSSFGDIVFVQKGNRIEGTYPTGTIEGVMVGSVLDGYWIESSGKGRIRFEFSSDFSEFNGKYGYGEDTPNSFWSGEKR